MEDPANHCELAEGPFPQGTGQLTCMSQPLALELAASAEFADFRRVAMARNDFGAKCESAGSCAKHAAGLHMWHHEDAGISYNVWRVATARQLSVSLVHLAELGWLYHSPDGWPKKATAETSARAIFVHKATPAAVPGLLARWQLGQPFPADAIVDCSQSCASWGWEYARRPCETPPTLPPGRPWRGFGAPWNGSHCRINPVAAGWRCCFLRTLRDK